MVLQLWNKISLLFDSEKKKSIYGIFVSMIVAAILEMVSISAVLPLLTAMMENAGTSSAVKMKIWFVVLIALFLIKNLFLYEKNRIQAKFALNTRKEMQVRLLEVFLQKPYSYYLNSTTGEILRMIFSDVQQVFSALQALLGLFTDLFMVAALSVLMIITSPVISLTVLLLLGIQVVIIVGCIRPLSKKAGEETRKEGIAAYQWMLQAIKGIKSIKVSLSEEFFLKKYEYHVDRDVMFNYKYAKIAVIPKLMLEAVTITGVLTTLYILLYTGHELETLIPELSMLAMATIKLLPGVSRISQTMGSLSYYEASVEEIAKIYREENLYGKPFPGNITKDESAVKVKERMEFANAIQMDDVTFSYDERLEPVLKHASLKIGFNKSIGIIGKTGAGKTTAFDLMLGLLEPEEGVISVDGVSILENIRGWRAILSYVPQDIYLIKGNVWENVTIGIPESEISMKRVEESLKDAQIWDYINSLPDGVNTQLGEGGIRLSGGQKQRIGIARALYRQPVILFFDEATSALDQDTENAVMDAINHLKGKKTMVIIAHRLSTIKNCDEVYEVKNGRIQKKENYGSDSD